MQREVHLMRLFSSIGVADIWTRAKGPYRQLSLVTSQVKLCYLAATAEDPKICDSFKGGGGGC